MNLVFAKVRRHSGNITEGIGWVIIAPHPEAAEAHCSGPLACLPCPLLHWGRKLERRQDQGLRSFLTDWQKGCIGVEQNKFSLAVWQWALGRFCGWCVKVTMTTEYLKPEEIGARE